MNDRCAIVHYQSECEWHKGNLMHRSKIPVVQMCCFPQMTVIKPNNNTRVSNQNKVRNSNAVYGKSNLGCEQNINSYE